MMELDDRTFAVTGVASGIGAASARLLKSRGARVIGFDRRAPESDLVDQFIHFDQADPEAIDAAANAAAGGLDGLLNIAGIPPSADVSPTTVLMVNYYGLRRLTEAMLDRLTRGAAIVNLASGAGLGWMGNLERVKAGLAPRSPAAVAEFVAAHGIHNAGLRNDAAYPLSKQLLIVWTLQSYALWQQHGVRMNAIAPAGVATPILDTFLDNFGTDAARRMAGIGSATPESIAAIAVMLLDPALDWINGAVIPAERGAITAGMLAQFGF